MKIKTLIIDDEAPARQLLRTYLGLAKEVEVVGECADGFDGLKSIQESQPELVFLDIQMPKLNGFELLELLDEKPQIIFTTAYDEYAIKAFEQNAVDYLLKPFSEKRLLEAVERAKQRIHDGGDSAVSKMMEEGDSSGFLRRIVVKTGHKIRIIPTNEILYLEAQDDYVMIYLDKEKHLKQKTMRYFESKLDPSEFIRIHRSYIVRISFVGSIELYEKDSYIIKLKDGNSLPVSKSGYNNLRSKLNF